MKNTATNFKDKIISRYLEKNSEKHQPKSTDINVLLNRVKINQKNETKRKIIFYSSTVLALSLLGTLITVLK